MTPSAPSRGKVAAAFAIVYVIWGSTYLAILYAIETLPPLLMAAARFFLAGGLLFAWRRPRGAQTVASVRGGRAADADGGQRRRGLGGDADRIRRRRADRRDRALLDGALRVAERR